MSEVHFKITPHTREENGEIIEIWIGDKMVGAIYPGQHSIRVVSKYMSMVIHEHDAPETWRVMFSEHIA